MHGTLQLKHAPLQPKSSATTCDMYLKSRTCSDQFLRMVQELHVWRARLDTSCARCRGAVAATQSMLASEAAKCRLEVATACDKAEFDIVTCAFPAAGPIPVQKSSSA